MVGCASNMKMAEFTGGKLDHKDHKNVEYFVLLFHINVILCISVKCSSLWSQM